MSGRRANGDKANVGAPLTRYQEILKEAAEKEKRRPHENLDEVSEALRRRFLSLLDRNLCVTEDSCLFFDSINAMASIIARARRRPFLPQPSPDAFENKFIDMVRMHANLPDLRLPKNASVYSTDGEEHLAFGGREGDPVARMVKELRRYTDQNVSEAHLLETIRRTSTSNRTARDGRTVRGDASGADANRFRAAFETAKTMLQNAVGTKNYYYKSMFSQDDPQEEECRNILRRDVPSESIVEFVLPYLDVSGNARYVPPYYETLSDVSDNKTRFKCRPWGRRMWCAAVRRRWYESDRSVESMAATKELLTRLVDKHERELALQSCHSDSADGDISLMDLALLGGLNPRTFFDVAIWHFPNKENHLDFEDAEKSQMTRTLVVLFMSFLTDGVYDYLIQQGDPKTALKQLKSILNSGKKEKKRHAEKRMFRNFWRVANDMVSRIDPKRIDAMSLEIDRDEFRNRAERVHHFLYNKFESLEDEDGYMPDMVIPKPSSVRRCSICCIWRAKRTTCRTASYHR